jgi:hypothetical protein
MPVPRSMAVMYDQPPMLGGSADLIRRQSDILRHSDFTNPELDACFALHCELVSLLVDIQTAMQEAEHPGRLVSQFSGQLDQWWGKWSTFSEGPFKFKECVTRRLHYQSTDFSC